MREDRFFHSSWHFLGTYYVPGTMSNLHTSTHSPPNPQVGINFGSHFTDDRVRCEIYELILTCGCAPNPMPHLPSRTHLCWTENFLTKSSFSGGFELAAS